MSTFTLRRWLLIASLMFCQVALADAKAPPAKTDAKADVKPDAKADVKTDAKADVKPDATTPPKDVEAKSDSGKKAEADVEPVQEPTAPFKLIAALKPVSMAEVDAVIEQSDRAVQSCSKNARRLDTLAVMMAITIDGDGKVSEVVPAPEGGDKVPPEAACLAKLTRKLKFPATGTTTHVEYPFMIVSRVNRAPSY
jgi:hypothetical protein